VIACRSIAASYCVLGRRLCALNQIVITDNWFSILRNSIEQVVHTHIWPEHQWLYISAGASLIIVSIANPELCFCSVV